VFPNPEIRAGTINHVAGVGTSWFEYNHNSKDKNEFHFKQV
jgi:hypothetical protein